MLKGTFAISKKEAKRICNRMGDSAVTEGIMMWITVAIILVVFLPVLSAVLTSTPQIVTNPLDVGNLSGGGGVLGTAAMNATQGNTYLMVGNSYGLLIVVLIILAAVILLGVIAYLRGKGQ